jgi:hypothetical protein
MAFGGNIRSLAAYQIAAVCTSGIGNQWDGLSVSVGRLDFGRQSPSPPQVWCAHDHMRPENRRHPRRAPEALAWLGGSLFDRTEFRLTWAHAEEAFVRPCITHRIEVS